MVNGGDEGVLLEPVGIFPDSVEWYVDFNYPDPIPLIYIVGYYDARPGSWARYPRSSKLQVGAGEQEHRMRASGPGSRVLRVRNVSCGSGCRQ